MLPALCSLVYLLHFLLPQPDEAAFHTFLARNSAGLFRLPEGIRQQALTTGLYQAPPLAAFFARSTLDAGKRIAAVRSIQVKLTNQNQRLLYRTLKFVVAALDCFAAAEVPFSRMPSDKVGCTCSTRLFSRDLERAAIILYLAIKPPATFPLAGNRV